MWQQDPGEKMTFDEAVAGASSFNLAGYDDCRLPTIKELYSLIDFSGVDPSGYEVGSTESLVSFINTDYFVYEYGDATITDNAINLMWMETNSGNRMTWEEALNFAESFEYAGNTDWRLPDAKELQSIVDYSRAPVTTGTAAIDPIFECTSIVSESGENDFP